MKRLLLIATSLTFGLSTIAQTILFQDDFESGSGNWTLNAGGFGSNDWIVNNSYTGNFFTTTPSQPLAITNSPMSQYLHIYNGGLACGSFGDCQAVFLAGSGGDKTAVMTNNISTIGQTTVTIDFWYLCMGAVTTYGTVDYSLDNGTTWLAASPNYQGTMNWTSQSITNVAWDNQAQLKFRFHWYEGTTGNDPAFAVDQFVITGVAGATNSITTTNDFTPTGWCAGTTTTGTVNFVSTGIYTAGNVYTAQLSDAAGSFAAPTSIGTLNSTASGSLSIPVAISGVTPAGAGYRVRVIASAPAVTGSDNSADIAIFALPSVSQASFADQCVNGGVATLIGGTPAGGTYSGTGVSGGLFNPTTAGVGSHSITYSYTDGNGCSGSAVQPILVNTAPTVTLAAYANVCVTEVAFSLSGGSPAGGTYTGPGVTGGSFDPATAGTGTHTITYTYTDGNGCTNTANQTLLVDACLGVDDLLSASVVLYPNPTETTFTLQSDLILDQVVVMDMNGRIVKNFGNETTYDVSDLMEGMYMVQILAGDAQLVKRLIIR